MRDRILNKSVDILQEETKNFRIGQNLVKSEANFDLSKVVDLNAEDNANFLEEMEEDGGNLVIELNKKDDDENQNDGKSQKH